MIVGFLYDEGLAHGGPVKGFGEIRYEEDL